MVIVVTLVGLVLLDMTVVNVCFVFMFDLDAVIWMFILVVLNLG